MTDLVEQLISRWQACKEQRQTLDTTWEEMADLYRPSRQGFMSMRSPGDNRMARIYDGEQLEAVNELAHSIETMTVPRAERWLEVGTEDQVEAADDDASWWLDDASKVTLQRLYEPQAGFQNVANQVFNDLVVFGAGPARTGQRADFSGFLFRSTHLRDLHWWRGETGLPETVYWRQSLRTGELQRKPWAANLSPDTKKAIEEDKKGTRRIELVEVVSPRYSGVVGSAHALDMPWGVYLIEVATKHLVYESGEHEMPWLIPEWEVLDDGDIWSPGRRGLPDVRQLQAMAKTILRGAQRAVSPAWLAPSDMGALDVTPDMINFYDPSILSKLGGTKLIEPLGLAGDVKLGLDMQEAQRAKVGNIFLRNVLRLPDKANMTATEVLRLNQDLVRLTDSPFGRLESTFVQPLVERCFNILLRESFSLRFGPGSPFKPWPESLQNRKAVFKFMSPVARARKLAETAQLATYIEALLPLFQAKPDALDNVDVDQLVRDYTAGSLAPKYLVPKDQVATVRKGRQDLAMQQEQMQQVQQGADAAGKATPFLQLIAGQNREAKSIGAG